MRWIYYKTVNFPGIDSCSEKASAFCSSSTRRNIKSNKYISNSMTTGFIMSKLIHVISMEFLSLSLGRSSWRNVPSSESKEKRLYSQGRLCKMADNRSKYINMNRKKSVKNRNPIRLCILPFYTIIFTTPFKSVQIVAWLSQNHRQATNPAREPQILVGFHMARDEVCYVRCPRAPRFLSARPNYAELPLKSESKPLHV